MFDKSSWASSVPAPYKTYLDAAADRWMLHAGFNQEVAQAIRNLYASQNPAENWSGIKLNSYTPFSDSTGENKYVLASCSVAQSVDLVSSGPGVMFNSTKFNLFINTAWATSNGLGGPLTADKWVDVLTHELGHALGIGIFWQQDYQSGGAVVPVNNFLNGAAYAQAQSAYNSITGFSRTLTPLEDLGSAGTVSAHWEDAYRTNTYAGGGGVDYRGLYDELMIGALRLDPSFNFKLSPLSLKILVDFGYVQVGPGEGDPQVVTGTSLRAQDDAIKMDCMCHQFVTPNTIGTVFLGSFSSST